MNERFKKIILKGPVLIVILGLVSCSNFQAKRVDNESSDEKAMEITNEWVGKDTDISVKKISEQIKRHRGFQQYRARLGRAPRVLISEVQNRTSEPYFPIEDLNDEMLTEFSQSGDFILIDGGSREKILEEIQYQHDGMVRSDQMAAIGRQSGADLLIFGAIRMVPKRRKGDTLKEYSVNMRMTNLESSEEVLRTRVRVNKYSQQSSSGW